MVRNQTKSKSKVKVNEIALKTYPVEHVSCIFKSQVNDSLKNLLNLTTKLGITIINFR